MSKRLRVDRMLDLAHHVVALADRLIGPLDDRAAIRAQLVVGQCGLELLLEIILAAFDLIDDRLVVAAGDRGLEVEPRLVEAAERRAVAIGLAPETPDFRLELARSAFALLGEVRKHPAELGRFDLLGRFAVAVDAVVQGRSEGLEGCEIVALADHGGVLLTGYWGQSASTRRPRGGCASQGRRTQFRPD